MTCYSNKADRAGFDERSNSMRGICRMYVKHLMSILAKVPSTCRLGYDVILTITLNLIPYKNNQKWTFVREWLASRYHSQQRPNEKGSRKRRPKQWRHSTDPG